MCDSLTQQQAKKSINIGIQALEEIQQYRQMKEHGRLQILPCAVGDTIYKIEYPTMVKEDGSKWTVMDIKRATIAPLKFALCHLNSIGHLYFLTPEEAEAALEKMKGEEHE